MSKYLVISPSRKFLPISSAEIQWMWAIVNPKKDHLIQGQNFGLGIPNIGQITTTARTKGEVIHLSEGSFRWLMKSPALLICYVAFDFFVHKPLDRSDPTVAAAAAAGGISFVTGFQKTQISWVMRKTESGDQRSIFRSMNFRSSFRYGWIPDHGVDFFALFIQDLAEKWRDIFKKAENHLKDTVSIILPLIYFSGPATFSSLTWVLRSAKISCSKKKNIQVSSARS